MKTLALMLALSPLLPACAAKAQINVATARAEKAAPDLGGVLRIAARNHRRGHACPTGERTALTNAHLVLTSREFSLEGNYDDPPLFFAWATRDDAVTGLMSGRVQLDRHRDLAAMESETPFPHYYPVASAPPKPGERLWWIGYDWRDRERAFSERVFSGRLLRISVGQLVMDRPGAPGASGSCVLNDQGEVVGVQVITADMESGEQVGGAVGVWSRR